MECYINIIWYERCRWCVKGTVQVEGTSAAPSAGLIWHRVDVYLFLVPLLLLFLFSPATQTDRSGRLQGDRLCGLCLETLSWEKEAAHDAFIPWAGLSNHWLPQRFNIWYHRPVDTLTYWLNNLTDQTQSENEFISPIP